ncbi:PTS sugar transporter subunit IIA [Anaerosinus massiliensis]|uniref:PTS sugar transporter subunit IIA n=1 Tax=Massilibacillus massiliensis TaxID=1806837 RepID=UPI000DA61B41|nr:PTS sugar transporter subunit IIA [Massilibacillus massiliensis]
MLIDLTSEELIRLNIDADDWEDAIRKSADALLQNGKIKPGYIDAIIHTVKEVGPYIVLTKHVALPHARSEAGAIESAIGIATLKRPVIFGNKENDPVKYLFCLSAKNSESHLSALADLTALLEDQAFYDLLDHAKDASEVIQYIKNFDSDGTV